MITYDKQSWRTPPALFQELEARYARGGRFDLDAAADPVNALCENYYTAEDNSLNKTWEGSVFCNPPYKDLEPWVVKAQTEVELGNAAVVVLLLPARTGQQWFQTAIAGGEVKFIRGRVRFDPPHPDAPIGSPTEDSIVVIFESPIYAKAFNTKRRRAA